MSTSTYHLTSESEARKATELALQHEEGTDKGTMHATVCLVQQSWLVSVGDAPAKDDRSKGLCFEDGILVGKRTRRHVME